METQTEIIIDRERRPAIVKYTLKPILNKVYDWGIDQIGARHIADLPVDLEGHEKRYRTLQCLIKSLYERPETPIEELMKKYFPDLEVKRSQGRKNRVLWANDYITITEDE